MLKELRRREFHVVRPIVFLVKVAGTRRRALTHASIRAANRVPGSGPLAQSIGERAISLPEELCAKCEGGANEWRPQSGRGDAMAFFGAQL